MYRGASGLLDLAVPIEMLLQGAKSLSGAIEQGYSTEILTGIPPPNLSVLARCRDCQLKGCSLTSIEMPKPGRNFAA